MPYTVLKVISTAYFRSGIVSRDFGTVSGTQYQLGLDTLNKMLDAKTVNQGLIPYYSEYNFNAVPGQERYFVKNLISVDTLVFFIDTVRFQTLTQARIKYFGSSRADNINSLPYSYHVEPAFVPGDPSDPENGGGAHIYLYFKPQTNYPLQLWGQFRLNQVTLNQDLELTVDKYYIDFMEWELASVLCDEFNFDVPDGVTRKLQGYYSQISKQVGGLDLSMKKKSTLSHQRGGDGYAQANIGKGWTV